jgi:hypothetical protein
MGFMDDLSSRKAWNSCGTSPFLIGLSSLNMRFSMNSETSMKVGGCQKCRVEFFFHDF